MSPKLFIPGWGAAPALYRSGMAAGWHVLELPTFRAGRGELGPYSRCLREAIASRPGRVTLAGHSMGGAPALLAAAEEPERIARLLLFSPAGLRLVKSLGPLEFPTSPVLAGRALCTTSSDGSRRDNAPNTAGEASPGTSVLGKVSCLDQRLDSPGLELPVD